MMACLAYFVDAETRNISLSPICQGCDSTFQVSVPVVSSTSASATARDSDTEPSRAIKSRVWPAILPLATLGATAACRL